MPKELHRKLVRQANKKGLEGSARQRYIHGTLNKAEERSNMIRGKLKRNNIIGASSNGPTTNTLPIARGKIRTSGGASSISVPASDDNEKKRARKNVLRKRLGRKLSY